MSKEPIKSKTTTTTIITLSNRLRREKGSEIAWPFQFHLQNGLPREQAPQKWSWAIAFTSTELHFEIGLQHYYMQQRELSATIKHVHIKKVFLLGLKIGLYVLSSHTQLKSADFGVWIFFYATQKAICDESTFLFFLSMAAAAQMKKTTTKWWSFPWE